jgi:hypothetical protein
MTGSENSVCPDCSYPIAGLSEPRCPECGQSFDRRLLAEPTLARLRPAWERRGRGSLLRAVLSTYFNLVFRPRRFLGGLVQRDRVGRAVLWAIANAIAFYVIAVAAVLLHRVLYDREVTAFMDYWYMETYGEQLPALLALAVCAVPPILLCFVADLWMLRNRDGFRRLVKGICYTSALHLIVWALFLATHLAISVRECQRADSLLYVHESVPMIWWWLCASLSWQFLLLFLFVLRPGPATLTKSGIRTRGLCVLVLLCWGGGVYITCFDVYAHIQWELQFWSWGPWS